MDTRSDMPGNFEFRSDDGKLLVSAARESITTYFKNKQVLAPDFILRDKRFDSKRGCFVTLKENNDEKTLRGCIGFPEPIYKLSRALPESAVSAAVHDPRFMPVGVSDLRSLLVEVSVLSKPSLITVRSKKELLENIVVGKDGLIMKWEYGSGLLLPQVATEFGWDETEFLANLSMKAGAGQDQWLSPSSMIYKFQAQVFQEQTPEGDVLLEDRP